MLHRIAVTPDVFLDAGVDRNSEKLLSPLWNIFDQGNGLLVDFNDGEWIRYVSHMNLALPVRERIIRHLKKLKDMNRIISCDYSDWQSNDNNSWLIMVKRAKEQGLIDEIIMSETARLQSEFQLDDVIDFPIDFSDPAFQKISENKSWKLHKNKADLHSVIEKLFGYAKVATVIDPFLNCYREYYQKSIELLAGTLGTKIPQNTSRRLNLYTSKKKSGFTHTQFQKYWELYLREIAQHYRIDISIKILGKSVYSGLQLHDRYLLSEQCGVSIPSDFTIDQQGKERDAIWNLLSPESYAKQVYEFSINVEYPIEIQKAYRYTI